MSESLGFVCGGITFVSVGTDVGEEMGVDGGVGWELDSLLSTKAIHNPTLGPRRVWVYQCRREC